jgi:hypothetical protein
LRQRRQREPDTAAAHRDSVGHIHDRCDTGGIVFDGSALQLTLIQLTLTVK